jgi:uncharacterized membrane protein YtjA (UPF0391 family)
VRAGRSSANPMPPRIGPFAVFSAIVQGSGGPKSVLRRARWGDLSQFKWPPTEPAQPKPAVRTVELRENQASRRRVEHLVRWLLNPISTLTSAIHQEEILMLHYSVVFLVVALVAALFGFGGIAGVAAGIAKVLFFVFLVLAAVTFLFNLGKGGSRSIL